MTSVCEFLWRAPEGWFQFLVGWTALVLPLGYFSGLVVAGYRERAAIRAGRLVEAPRRRPR